MKTLILLIVTLLLSGCDQTTTSCNKQICVAGISVFYSCRGKDTILTDDNGEALRCTQSQHN